MMIILLKITENKRTKYSWKTRIAKMHCTEAEVLLSSNAKLDKSGVAEGMKLNYYQQLAAATAWRVCYNGTGASSLYNSSLLLL